MQADLYYYQWETDTADMHAPPPRLCLSKGAGREKRFYYGSNPTWQPCNPFLESGHVQHRTRIPLSKAAARRELPHDHEHRAFIELIAQPLLSHTQTHTHCLSHTLILSLTLYTVHQSSHHSKHTCIPRAPPR